MIDGLRIDEAHKGGKGAAPAPMPLVAPAAPIEEASVEIDDSANKKKKLQTSKSSLKLPLANTDTTGLKV